MTSDDELDVFDEDFDEDAVLGQLRAALQRRGVQEAARLIYHHIQGEDVSLTQPQWLDVWREVRPHYSRFIAPAPPRVMKDLDELFESVQPTDPRAFDLRIRGTDSVVVILGAGASAPEPSNLETVADLLPKLWRRAGRLGREDLRALENWCKEEGISNIEDLLTAAYIANFASKNSQIISLLDYFLYSREPTRQGLRRRVQSNASALALLQETFQTLFGLLLGRMIEAEPNVAHEAIVKLAAETGKVGVLTTNYDGCIDQAFANAGVDCNYFLGESNGADSGAQIVKMHGSINWAYCDSCQETHVYQLSALRRAYEEDSIGFPVISICKGCGGQRRPMIVPPLSFKFVQFPPLLRLWHQAQVMLNDASLIIPIGYSFSEADTYITKMTIKAMVDDQRKKLVVVDCDSGVAARVSRQLSDVIDDFDTERVLRSIESCEKIVPRLLETLLAPAQTEDGHRERDRETSAKVNP